MMARTRYHDCASIIYKNNYYHKIMIITMIIIITLTKIITIIITITVIITMTCFQSEDLVSSVQYGTVQYVNSYMTVATIVACLAGSRDASIVSWRCFVPQLAWANQGLSLPAFLSVESFSLNGQTKLHNTGINGWVLLLTLRCVDWPSICGGNAHVEPM